MAKKSWYLKGKNGWKKAQQVDEEAKARQAARGPLRFWLEPDSSAKVTFLDTPSFFIYEHNLQLDGKWGNYFTCLKDFDTCPLCESGDRSSFAVVGTVISHKPWKDRDGNVHKNTKMLFVARGKARDRVKKQIERRKDLKFCLYEISRGSSKNESSVGEDFEFIRKLSQKTLLKLVPEGEDPKEWLRPFDYEEVLAPKDPAELRKLVGLEDPVGSGEEIEDDPFADDDDDFPFDVDDDNDNEEKGKKKRQGKKKDDDDEDDDLEDDLSIDDLL